MTRSDACACAGNQQVRRVQRLRGRQIATILSMLACVAVLAPAGALADGAGGAWGGGSAASGHALAHLRGSQRRFELRSGHLAASAAASPAVSGGGTIAGKVTSAKTGLPVQGFEVCGFSGGSEAHFAGCTATNASGEYELDEVAPATYTVEFFAPFGAGEKDNFTAQTVTGVLVEAGRTATVNAALAAGGKISGKVTGTGAAPVPGVEVCAREASTGIYEGCAETEADGTYTIYGLTGGKDIVQFVVGFVSDANYAPQFYPDAALLENAKAVTVKAEQTTAEIDASLTIGGQIEGTVTSAATGSPIEGVEVCAFEEGEAEIERCAESGAGGHYDVASLGTGDYTVVFFPFAVAGEFEPEELSKVKVTAGSATPVNVALTAATSSEVPLVLTPPSIGGTPQEGQSLTAANGIWSGAPTGFRDEWGRCANATAIESCHTILSGSAPVTGATYKLTAADVGRYIRVKEVASNAAGESVPSISAPTALVGTAPAPAPTPGGPAPTPPATVLGITVAHFSTAQLKSLLAAFLTPHGSAAKIGALLKHGGYTTSVATSVSGQLEITWRIAPQRAHGATATSILAAVGHVTLSGHGSARLNIKLTAKGRSLLRHAARVKVSAAGVLSPTGQSAVSASSSFALRH